jgi:hypothetical protein
MREITKIAKNIGEITKVKSLAKYSFVSQIARKIITSSKHHSIGEIFLILSIIFVTTVSIFSFSKIKL